MKNQKINLTTVLGAIATIAIIGMVADKPKSKTPKIVKPDFPKEWLK